MNKTGSLVENFLTDRDDSVELNKTGSLVENFLTGRDDSVELNKTGSLVENFLTLMTFFLRTSFLTVMTGRVEQDWQSC